MNPKVSIIIPVYKTEAYLAECIESVRNQTYNNLEIILIDDGSPDSCPVICDDFALKDSRVKVIHKENSGQAESKNIGLEISEGSYITFLDSDDKLDGNTTIVKMVNAALEYDADIVVGSFRRFDSESESKVNPVPLKTGENTRTLDFRFRGFYQYGHLAYTMGKLYRKSFITENNIKHNLYSYAEDKAFNIRAYAYNPRYAFLKESVYCYRKNENSLSFKYKKDLMDIWITIVSDYIGFLKKRKIKNEFGDLISFQIYFGIFFVVKQELDAGKGIFETAKLLKEYAKNPLVKKLMKRILTKGYTKNIKSKGWRLMIWGSTVVYNLHLYILFVLGVAIIKKTEMDQKVSRKRFGRK